MAVILTVQEDSHPQHRSAERSCTRGSALQSFTYKFLTYRGCRNIIAVPLLADPPSWEAAIRAGCLGREHLGFYFVF